MPPAALPGLRLHARRAIPGPGGLAGPPPGGRTSGRPCSCACLARGVRSDESRAAVRQTLDGSGLPMPWSRRCWPSAGRMPKRGQHRASEGQDARSERPAMGHGQPRACGTHDAGSVGRDGTSSPEPASSRAATSRAVFRLKPIPAGSLTAPRRVLTVRNSPVAASAFPRTWGVPPGGVRFASLRRRITRSAR